MDKEKSNGSGISSWVSVVVLALVFSVAGYIAKGRSLGMSLGQTALIGVTPIGGACVIGAVVHRYRQ